MKEQKATPSILYPDSLKKGAKERVATGQEGETNTEVAVKATTGDKQTAGGLPDIQTSEFKVDEQPTISSPQTAGNVNQGNANFFGNNVIEGEGESTNTEKQ